MDRRNAGVFSFQNNEFSMTALPTRPERDPTDPSGQQSGDQIATDLEFIWISTYMGTMTASRRGRRARAIMARFRV
jgi:hypothetical protein